MKTYTINGEKVSHDNVRISDMKTLNDFLLDELEQPNELDEAVRHFIHQSTFGTSNTFQVAGDGDGLGLIIDIFNDEEEDIDCMTIWFEDYEEFK